MPTDAITLENARIQFDNKVVFKDISLSIPSQKVTAIMGPSGIGKSSILRILSHQTTPKRGALSYHGTALERMDHDQLNTLHREMGFLFQNSALLLNLSVYENIALPIRYHYDLPEDLIAEIVTMKLHAVNLTEARDLYPEQLSGGMVRRVAIARCIALDPKIIFCDEPFTGQDPINAKSLAQLIKKMTQHLQATTVVVSHEVQLTFSFADHIYLLNHDGIVCSGSPHSICQKPCDYTRAFLGEDVIAYYQKKEAACK